MMKQSELIIRTMQSEEYPLLGEFLYQAIFLPEGTVPPSRSVIDLPSYKSILLTSVLGLGITAL